MVYIQVYTFKTGRYIRDHQHNLPHEKKLKKGCQYTFFRWSYSRFLDKFKWIALLTEMTLWYEIPLILAKFLLQNFDWLQSEPKTG